MTRTVTWRAELRPLTHALSSRCTSCYAEDVKGLIMARTAEVARLALSHSSVLLGQRINTHGMAQNASKVEHVATFLGQG